MFSQSIFVGFVATDPELKKTKTEKSLCTFNLAVGRQAKTAAEKSIPDFHRIEVWNEYAKFISETVKKGDKLVIVSRPSNRTYKDGNGGNRTMTYFTASQIEFAGAKREKYVSPPIDLLDYCIESEEAEEDFPQC